MSTLIPPAGGFAPLAGSSATAAPASSADERVAAGSAGAADGFAGALDAAVEAAAPTEAAVAPVLIDAASSVPPSIPLAASPLASSPLASSPLAPSPQPPSPLALDAAGLAADARNAAPGAAGGWPPPGLAALFPDRAGAAAGGLIGLVRGGPIAAMAAGPAPAAGPASAVTFGPWASGSTTAPGGDARSLRAAASAAEPFAAASGRPPAVLRLPESLRDSLGPITAAALDALPLLERGGDAFGGTSATNPPMPRLDLAAAFPAPLAMHAGKPVADELGARLRWMVDQGGGEATLRIAPEGLGPVEIRLKLDGERLDLGFSAAHGDTRQALHDALPRLREMLAQQGLQLGHADVGQRQDAPARDGEARHSGESSGGEPALGDAALMVPTTVPKLLLGSGARGLLDLYA